MVLLKGIGSIPEAIAQQGNVLVSSFISGLYQYVLTSANPPLSSESCALLTICYLSSLQQGELISPDQLHATLHYTQLGETEWLQYYRKHKKMSESTFVQSQLVHLSKIAVYPVVGRVQVMVSSQSLGEGILYTLSSVAHIAKTTKASLPDFIVMLTVQSSASMEFCVLVLQPIQARLITDQLGRGRGSSHAPPPCPDLLMDKELLLCMRGHQRRLGGKVLPPFLRPGEVHTPLTPEEASSLAPPTSHIIEHRPEGPYQQQYSLALFLLQKTLAALCPHTRMEDFDKVDFAVLCPSEDAFVVQMTADILDSQLLLHLEGGGEGAGLEPDQLLKAAEKRVIDCGRGQEKLEAFVSTMESHPKTLYVVVVENAHLLTAVAMDPTHFCETGCHIENKRLLSTHNAILLCVTSQPSRLLTNRSLLPITNELYWPSKDSAPMGEQQFWSSSFGKPSGLIFREDPIFEKLFHDVCSTQRWVCPITSMTSWNLTVAHHHTWSPTHTCGTSSHMLTYPHMWHIITHGHLAHHTWSPTHTCGTSSHMVTYPHMWHITTHGHLPTHVAHHHTWSPTHTCGTSPHMVTYPHMWHITTHGHLPTHVAHHHTWSPTHTCGHLVPIERYMTIL